MLHDVRQRLLHDAVERRLDVARQALRVEPGLEVDRQPGLFTVGVREPLESRDEAEVVERARAQLDGEAPDVLERCHQRLPQLRDAPAQLVFALRVLHGLQPQERRGQRLPGLVVELARESLPLELLSVNDAFDYVAGDAAREVDGYGGSSGERLGEPHVVPREPRIRCELVEDVDDADRLASHKQRHPQSGSSSQAPGNVLIGFRIVEQRVDPLAARTLELMSPERQLQVFEELDEGEALGLLALMSPDEAADLVGRLETDQARRHLERLPRRKSAAVVELLRYPEDTAGGVMTNDVAFVASSLTAREARERLRGRLKETDFALLVYAVEDEERRRLRGLLSLRNLIVADDDARVEDFMDPYVTTLSPLEEAGAAARRVINSHMPALPVVGEDKRLLGVVTFEAAVMRAAPASWRAQAPRRVFS